MLPSPAAGVASHKERPGSSSRSYRGAALGVGAQPQDTGSVGLRSGRTEAGKETAPGSG